MPFEDDSLLNTSGFFGMGLAKRMDWLENLTTGSASWRGNGLENLLVAVLTGDGHLVIRHEAAFALGNLYSRGRIEGNYARAALCSCASDDPSIVVRHECTEALAAFVGAEVKEVLRRLITDSDADVAATAAFSWERLERRESGGS